MLRKMLLKIECRSAQSRLWDHQHGRLTRTQAKGLEAHIAKCSRCLEEIDFARSATAASRVYALTAPRSARVWDEIREKINLESTRSRPFRRPVHKPVAAAFGVIALAAFIWASMKEPSPDRRQAISMPGNLVRNELKALHDSPAAALPAPGHGSLPYTSPAPRKLTRFTSRNPGRQRLESEPRSSSFAAQVAPRSTERHGRELETVLSVSHASDLNPVEPDRSNLVSGTVPGAGPGEPVTLVAGSTPTVEGLGEQTASVDTTAGEGP